MCWKLVLALGCLAGLTSAMDRALLSKRPGGDPNADIEKLAGRWYLYATTVPCSWNGANAFTDWTLDFSVDRQTGNVNVLDTWRDGDTCTSVTVKYAPQSQSCFILTDPLGNLWSGDIVLVATDNKKFAIYWGCSKKAPDGVTCADYYVSVDTRHRNPSKHTLHIIDHILQKLWKFPLSQLRKIPHDMAC